MINFDEMQENIRNLGVQQQAMATTLSRLETTVATLCSRAEADEMEERLKETLSAQHRAIERLDVAYQAASKVVDSVPVLQREWSARMSDIEQGAASNLNALQQKLGSIRELLGPSDA